MQMIDYPGNLSQQCQAEYGIALREDSGATRSNIVVINSPRAGQSTSLWNGVEGRNVILNKILANELKGVRTQWVRFFSLVDAGAPDRMHGIELPIQLDFSDYRKKGNPYDVWGFRSTSFWGRVLDLSGRYGRFSYWSGHVVGGCANFVTRFEERRGLPPEEIESLCAAVGYQRRREGPPKWFADRYMKRPGAA